MTPVPSDAWEANGMVSLTREGSNRAPFVTGATSTRSTIRRTISRRWPKSASDQSRLGSGFRTIRWRLAASTSAWRRSTSRSNRALIER
jgi:hypothetical protein